MKDYEMLARDAELPSGTVQNWYFRKTSPLGYANAALKSFEKVAHGLGVSPSDLLFNGDGVSFSATMIEKLAEKARQIKFQPDEFAQIILDMPPTAFKRRELRRSAASHRRRAGD